jgi:hypothetical protein
MLSAFIGGIPIITDSLPLTIIVTAIPIIIVIIIIIREATHTFPILIVFSLIMDFHAGPLIIIAIHQGLILTTASLIIPITTIIKRGDAETQRERRETFSAFPLRFSVSAFNELSV